MKAARALFNQPRRFYMVAVPLLVLAWLVSSIGRQKSKSDGAEYYVGAAFWSLFLVTFLLSVAFTLVQLVRLARRARTPAVRQ